MSEIEKLKSIFDLGYIKNITFRNNPDYCVDIQLLVNEFKEYEAKFEEFSKRTTDAELNSSLLEKEKCFVFGEIDENREFTITKEGKAYVRGSSEFNVPIYQIKKDGTLEIISCSKCKKLEEALERVLKHNMDLIKEVSNLWDRVDGQNN